MSKPRQRTFRPCVEIAEPRRLLSSAVVDIQNNSSYTVTFRFRWSPYDYWTSYTERPGAGELLWTNGAPSLAPQVSFNASSSPFSGTTVYLAQGYGEWSGTGTPPAWSATEYQFLNTSSGIVLDFASPPIPTQAVVSITNDSTYTITFGFRWTPTDSWNTYTEEPGQGEIFWTPYSNNLTPQALYDATTSPGSQLDVSLAQGYGEWMGAGTPPGSAASRYGFLNNSSGVELDYTPSTPQSPGPGVAPTPAPAPNPLNTPNWSGFVAAGDVNNPVPNSVTMVSGAWVVPAVLGPASGSYASSTWIGIDGFGNSTVEQLGTEQDVINGVPYYRAWWEMFSSGALQPEQPIANMVIMPGDSISALVQYETSGVHAGQFLLEIVDKSRSNDSFITYQSSQGTQDPFAERSTAEWIMEAPTTVGGGVDALPVFSPVVFTNAQATINGITGAIGDPAWSAAPLNLAVNGVTQAATSVLNSSGSGFTVSSSGGGVGQADAGNNLQTAEQQVGFNDPQVIVVGKLRGPSAGSGVVVSVAPASVSVGTPFVLNVDVVDSNGLPLAGYDLTVAIDVVAGPGLAVSNGPEFAAAANGRASFSGTGFNQPGTYTILIVAASMDPILYRFYVSPAASPPAVTSAAVIFGAKHPTSSSKILGFSLTFNKPLDQASASNPGNFEILQYVLHRRKKIAESVPFEVVFDPTSNSVRLLLEGRKSKSLGGSLVVYTSRIADTQGDRGIGSSFYTILANDRGIAP